MRSASYVGRVCVVLLACACWWTGPAQAAGTVVDVSDQVAAGRTVLAELGFTKPREDRMASANHGVAEELREIRPAALGITPDDGAGNVPEAGLRPQIDITIDVWQTAAAAESYSLQLVPDSRLLDVTDAPQGRMREAKSDIGEAVIGGESCYVATRRGAFIGNNVTVYLEYKLAAKVPQHPDPRRQSGLRDSLKGHLQSAALFDFLGLAGRLALASETHGLTRRGGGLVKLLDANPLFTQGIGVPFTTAIAPDQIHRLTELNALRRGAAADGVSALLLVARVPAKGRAAFRVANAPADGTVVKLPAQNLANWRAAATAAVDQVAIVELTRNADRAKSHFAFALYLPPPEFGEAHAGSGMLTRTVSVTFQFESEEPGVQPHTEQVPIELIRPPVVLVHGTYDNPSYCWQEGEPSLGGVSLFQRLVDSGYRFREDGNPAVFAVDYEASQDRLGQYHSSGLSNHEQQVTVRGVQVSSSSFANNANVVYDNPQGIRRAIEVYRARRYAATQADVVCHSLGGLVTRLYARGFPLGQAVPAEHYRDPVRCVGCWYHRPDNAHRGDIHRLITVCSTHKGSDIPGLLLPYGRVITDPAMNATVVEKQMVNGLLFTVDWLTGNGGAFRNQEPNSAELNVIGPTPVPAHAVAATCSWQDIAQFDGFYRGRLNKIYLGSPKRVMVDAFRRIGMPRTGQRLGRMIDEGRDSDTILMTFWQGVFGNTPNDFTVRLESALGGLTGQFTTVHPGVLHGYAPRYPQLQATVQALLSGPQSRFNPAGFPVAGGAVRNQDR